MHSSTFIQENAAGVDWYVSVTGTGVCQGFRPNRVIGVAEGLCVGQDLLSAYDLGRNQTHHSRSKG